jgi:NDP-sugar pyrophosphorylase family protein
MITSCTITVIYDNVEEQFTAILQEPFPESWSVPDEPEGTGETLADALRDLADQCEEVFA